jgi:hypothetical protein
MSLSEVGATLVSLMLDLKICVVIGHQKYMTFVEFIYFISFYLFSIYLYILQVNNPGCGNGPFENSYINMHVQNCTSQSVKIIYINQLT